MIKSNISKKSQINYWKKILSKKNSITLIVSLVPILYGVIRNGHENYNASVIGLIIAADIIAIIGNRKIIFKSYGKELWLGLTIIALEIPLQIVFFGNEYYGKWSAFWGLVTIAIMVFSISFILKKRYGIIIWKTIEVIGLFNAFLIIIQYVGKIVGIRLDNISGLSDILFKTWEFQGGAFFRASGMFSEPSHFAELGLLALFYCLFVDNNIKKSVFLVIALLLSTSSLGILGSLMLVILYVLGMDQFTNIKKGIKTLIVILTLLIVVVTIWWASESTNIVIQRLFSGGSMSVRTLRSFELYSVMGAPEKIIGIGLLNQELYLNFHNIILASDNYETLITHREFAQAFGYLLCTTGIIGLIGFCRPFWKMAYDNTWRVKSLLLLFLTICMTCSILMRTAFFLYLLAIFALIDYEKYKPEKNYRKVNAP